MADRKRSVVIDDELLAAARELLGTSTVRETLERALLEVVQRHARMEEIRALSTTEGTDLADASVMAGAWRQ
jgi:Arc/MetJ family transcription regulator